MGAYLTSFKRIGFLLLLIACLVSCDKEESGVLDYTTWKGYNDAGILRLLAFKPNNIVEDFIYLSLDGEPILYKISYTLNGNHIELIQATGVYATGEFNDDVLTIDYGGENGIWTLNKQ